MHSTLPSLPPAELLRLLPSGSFPSVTPSSPSLPQPCSPGSPPRSTQKPLEKAAFPVSTSSSLLTLPALKPLQPRFCSQRPTEASPEASSSLATCKGHVSVLILQGLPATSGLFFSPPSLKHSFSLALVTPYVASFLKCTSGGPVRALGGCGLCSGLGTACSVLPAWQGPHLPTFGNSFSSSPLGSQLRCRKPPLTPLTPAGPGTLPGSPDALLSPCHLPHKTVGFLQLKAVLLSPAAVSVARYNTQYGGKLKLTLHLKFRFHWVFVFLCAKSGNLNF